VTDLSLDKDIKPNCLVVAAVTIKSAVHLFWVDEEVTQAKGILSALSNYSMSFLDSDRIKWISIKVAAL
jgi:hypothetical protein